MKLPRSSIKLLRGARAFTLLEAMIASTTLVIVIGSVIMCNLFGLAMAARQQIWVGASDDAAQALGIMMGDIRSAVALQVGSYANNIFTPAGATSQQSGSALLIFTNTGVTFASGPWTMLYYDSVSNNLVRSNFYAPGNPGDFKMVSANWITNDATHPIFTELDCTDTGTAISNVQSLTPVAIYLSFTKLQDPQIVIENGSVVDLYQILATITPRQVLTE
jgi:Tfp pilus assembly protein PilW